MSRRIIICVHGLEEIYKKQDIIRLFHRTKQNNLEYSCACTGSFNNILYDIFFDIIHFLTKAI